MYSKVLGYLEPSYQGNLLIIFSLAGVRLLSLIEIRGTISLQGRIPFGSSGNFRPSLFESLGISLGLFRRISGKMIGAVNVNPEWSLMAVPCHPSFAMPCRAMPCGVAPWMGNAAASVLFWLGCVLLFLPRNAEARPSGRSSWRRSVTESSAPTRGSEVRATHYPLKLHCQIAIIKRNNRIFSWTIS